MTYENVVNMGADPEFFVIKNGGKLATSAHLLDFDQRLKDQKGASFNYEESKILREVKRDGFAIEFNPPAQSCRDGLRAHIQHSIFSFMHVYGQEYSLSAMPVQRLTPSSINSSAPDDVMGYGCVPDFNAYDMQEKSPPTTGYHDSYRYTGGHLHMSVHGTRKGISFVAAAAHAIMADIWLSIPLVAIIGEVNNYGEKARREYYGQAGSFRHTSYGYEYRVPSSIIFASSIIMTWAMGQHRRGQLIFGKNTKTNYDSYNINSNMSDDAWIKLVEEWDTQFGHSEIQRIVNEHDVLAAREFVEKNKKFYTKMYYRPFYDLMLKADEKEIALNTNLAEAWNINASRVETRSIRNQAPGVEYATGDNRFRSSQFALSIFPQIVLKQDKAWGDKVKVAPF